MCYIYTHIPGKSHICMINTYMPVCVYVTLTNYCEDLSNNNFISSLKESIPHFLSRTRSQQHHDSLTKATFRTGTELGPAFSRAEG